MLRTRQSLLRITAILLLALGFAAQPRAARAQMPDALIENGDPSGDGQCDLADALYLLKWLFHGGPEPVLREADDPESPESSLNGDVNADGRRDLTDVVNILSYLYQGGSGGALQLNLYSCDAALQTSLRKHLPRAIVHAGTDAVTLWGVLSDAVGQKRFTIAQGWARSWNHRQNITNVSSSDWTKSLPMANGFENLSSVVFGMFGYRDGVNRVGLPFLEAGRPPTHTGYIQTPAMQRNLMGMFTPRTVVSNRDTTSTHFFGILDDDGEAKSSSLRYPLFRAEVFWNQTTQNVPSAGAGPQVRFTDHGLPLLSGQAPFGVEPGPNSACTMSMRRSSGFAFHHFVFVTARFLSDTALFDKVTFLHFDGFRWAWDANLGSPVPNAEILGGPLAYTYMNSQGRYNMSVWVVARDRMSGDPHYRLYEKFFVDGNDDRPISSYFTGWTDHGFPPGNYDGAAWPAGTKFWITTGMTWGLSEGLRNNLFGYSDDFEDPQTGTTVNKQLIEHYFDNSTWQWGMILPSPDGKDFRTESCTVIENGTNRRLSVFGRTGLGAIYELAYTFTNGIQRGWFWTNLTCETFPQLVPQSP